LEEGEDIVEVIAFPGHVDVPRAQPGAYFTRVTFPKSPYHGFWMQLAFARCVLAFGAVILLVIILAMLGAFGREGDTEDAAAQNHS
jgi:hypothetical protein